MTRQLISKTIANTEKANELMAAIDILTGRIQLAHAKGQTENVANMQRSIQAMPLRQSDPAINGIANLF